MSGSTQEFVAKTPAGPQCGGSRRREAGDLNECYNQQTKNLARYQSKMSSLLFGGSLVVNVYIIVLNLYFSGGDCYMQIYI